MKESAEILDRLALFLGADSDTALADALGVSRSSISLYRHRGSIPYKHLVEFAKINKVNLNWLLLGEGEIERRSSNDSAEGDQGERRGLLREEQMALEAELGLGEVVSLARLGAYVGAWRVMVVIEDRFPEPQTAAEIHRDLQGEQDRKQLQAHLGLLERLGVVERTNDKKVGAYRLAKKVVELKSESSLEIHGHSLVAISELIHHILPAVEAERGKLLVAKAWVPKDASAALAREVFSTVKSLINNAGMAADNDEAEALTVVLGLANERGRC